MRIVASLAFALVAFTNFAPASAAIHGKVVTLIGHPPIGCMPWSGCRK